MRGENGRMDNRYPHLRAVSSDRSIRIYRGDGKEPILVQQAQADERPYLHPIMAPDGQGILTENAPAHHPWQHGIYVGLNDVNGVGFWTEGGPDRPHDGSFHPLPLQPAVVQGNRALWRVETRWRDPQGNLMITETQQWELQDEGSRYLLDFDWTLRAEIDLAFGQSEYGGLFLRMPYREDNGGIALNSEGLSNREAEGKRARWTAVSMPIEGRTDEAGIAFLDHPDNPEHPVPWRVDGHLGIAPSRCIAGPWKLTAGEASRNRYRIFVFTGGMIPDPIQQAWQAFAVKSKSTWSEYPV